MKRARYLITYITMVLAALAFPAGAAAARNSRLNDKIQNRPYADLRRWHLGFSIGMHTEDLRFTHNGLITDAGEQWRIEQPTYQPGFCVNGLIDLRLNTYFSLRLSPGMYFGSRDITMRELGSGAVERQNIKSTFVVLPLDLKFAAQRYRNSRPYILTGVMPAFDVSKKRSDFLRFLSALFQTYTRGEILLRADRCADPRTARSRRRPQQVQIHAVNSQSHIENDCTDFLF